MSATAMNWPRLIAWLAGFRCRRHGHRWIEHFTGHRSTLARCCPDCGCGQVKIANGGGHDSAYGGGPSCERGEDCGHAAIYQSKESAA
jgi:hypothetical protein